MKPLVFGAEAGMHQRQTDLKETTPVGIGDAIAARGPFGRHGRARGRRCPTDRSHECPTVTGAGGAAPPRFVPAQRPGAQREPGGAAGAWGIASSSDNRKLTIIAQFTRSATALANELAHPWRPHQVERGHPR